MTASDAPKTDLSTDTTLKNPDWRHFESAGLPQILEVTLDQMVKHGYHATTVRSIAREVGVTVPALYYHYENKQAMLVALLDHAMGIVSRHVDDALAEAGDDPVDRLSAIVEAIVLYMTHHGDLAFIDSERRALTPPNRDRYVASRDRIERILRETITEGCTAGLFATPYPDTCGRAILAMCQGIPGWFQPAGPDSPQDIAKRYVGVALAAVQAAPA